VKRDKPEAKIVIPRPLTCCETPRFTVKKAIRIPNKIPTKIANKTPSHKLLVKYAVRKATSEQKSITPSIPRFKTPDLSQKTSPRVAIIRGVAILKVADKRPIKKLAVNISFIRPS